MYQGARGAHAMAHHGPLERVVRCHAYLTLPDSRQRGFAGATLALSARSRGREGCFPQYRLPGSLFATILDMGRLRGWPQTSQTRRDFLHRQGRVRSQWRHRPVAETSRAVLSAWNARPQIEPPPVLARRQELCEAWHLTPELSAPHAGAMYSHFIVHGCARAIC